MVFAMQRAQDMVINNYFAHTSPIFGSFYSQFSEFGVSTGAENIATGTSAALTVLAVWYFSDGHYSILTRYADSLFGFGCDLRQLCSGCRERTYSYNPRATGGAQAPVFDVKKPVVIELTTTKLPSSWTSLTCTVDQTKPGEYVDDDRYYVQKLNVTFDDDYQVKLFELPRGRYSFYCNGLERWVRIDQQSFKKKMLIAPT